MPQEHSGSKPGQAGSAKGRRKPSSASRGATRWSNRGGSSRRGRSDSRGAGGRSGASGRRSGSDRGSRSSGRRTAEPTRGRSLRSRAKTRANETWQWTETPSPKYRPVGGDEEVRPPTRSAVRVVGQPGKRPAKSAGKRRAPARAKPRRTRRRRESEATLELREIAGARGDEAVATLERAADAYSAGREREAAKILRPLRDAFPDAASVRELLGLAQYRQGHYQAAVSELEEFVDLTGSVEQHPILMDCYRAQRRYGDVTALWEELRAASPAAAIVTEGRIVDAGALADQGKINAAIRELERGSRDVKQVEDHHLRRWYVLADLHERAGGIPSARRMFRQISRHDGSYADVAERLAALS